ncbi:hypothetical protein Ocin01_07387 [Orchesella cincta]|uniref:CUB domain-containing protein n=1 Tax=Orchesella cincta TaxID=48709 RepID=A0A1D2N303_ORCCI|nr:hypothetical protein Ocin01_07387 [Orchesella cincta]
MDISIILLVCVCCITNSVIGKRADFGLSGSHVFCESTQIVNKNEVYTFDEAMPSGLSPFQEIPTKPESSNDAYALPDDEFPLPRVPGVVSPPPYPKPGNAEDSYKGEDLGLFSPFHAARVQRGEDKLRESFATWETPTEFSDPKPPSRFPSDYEHKNYDNPEMRKFTVAPVQKLLPSHTEKRVPKREIKTDMMAGVKYLKGEPDSVNVVTPRINTFSALKKHVQRHPSLPAHEIQENDIESDGKVNNSSSNLPSYIEHILNKRIPNRAAALSVASSSLSKSNNPEPADDSDVSSSSSGNSNSLQDILGSLGPDKLDQLRQLLASSNTGSNGGNGASTQGRGQRRGFTGYRAKRSIDRKFHRQTISNNKYLQHKLANRVKPSRKLFENSQPEKCNIQFTKGIKCNRISFRLENWLDRVNDCSKEYLQVSDGTTFKKFCGTTVMKAPLYLHGSRVSITHYKSDGRVGGLKFKGGVRCD